MFYGLSEWEDYFASRVSVFVALGPVTKIPHGLIKLMNLGANHFYDLLADAANLFHVYALGSDKAQNPTAAAA